MQMVYLYGWITRANISTWWTDGLKVGLGHAIRRHSHDAKSSPYLGILAFGIFTVNMAWYWLHETMKCQGGRYAVRKCLIFPRKVEIECTQVERGPGSCMTSRERWSNSIQSNVVEFLHGYLGSSNRTQYLWLRQCRVSPVLSCHELQSYINILVDPRFDEASSINF
jgi:hypothetical protein